MKEQTKENKMKTANEILARQNENLWIKVNGLENQKQIMRCKLAFLAGYLRTENEKLANEIETLLAETH